MNRRDALLALIAAPQWLRAKQLDPVELALLNAPFDDEPITDAEQAAVDRAHRSLIPDGYYCYRHGAKPVGEPHPPTEAEKKLFEIFQPENTLIGYVQLERINCPYWSAEPGWTVRDGGRAYCSFLDLHSDSDGSDPSNLLWDQVKQCDIDGSDSQREKIDAQLDAALESGKPCKTPLQILAEHRNRNRS